MLFVIIDHRSEGRSHVFGRVFDEQRAESVTNPRSEDATSSVIGTMDGDSEFR